MKVLSQIGFRWHQNGAMLTVTVDGMKQDVFVPLNRLTIEFGDALADVGCPLLPAVGAEEYSVGGLFSRIKRAVKKGVKTAAKIHALPTSYVYKRVVPRAIRQRATEIRRAATRYVRRRVLPYAQAAKTFLHKSPYARYGAMALTAFPATAPAGASLMAAQRTMDIIERGRRAATLVRRGLRRPQDMRAMALAVAQQQGVAQLGQMAQQGNPQAMQFFGAMQQYAGRQPGFY